MTVAALILTVLASLALVAFCAGAETAFLSVRSGHVLHMARLGGARAKILQKALDDLGRTTTALLVGNNLACVTFSSASAALSSALFAQASAAQSVWSFLAALCVLYFGEFSPKLLCAARPLRRLLAMAPFWSVFARVFVPIGSVVQVLIVRLLPRREQKPRVTTESVLKLLEDRKDGVTLSRIERALVGRILALREENRSVSPEELLVALDDAMV